MNTITKKTIVFLSGLFAIVLFASFDQPITEVQPTPSDSIISTKDSIRVVYKDSVKYIYLPINHNQKLNNMQL